MNWRWVTALCIAFACLGGAAGVYVGHRNTPGPKVIDRKSTLEELKHYQERVQELTAEVQLLKTKSRRVVIEYSPTGVIRRSETTEREVERTTTKTADRTETRAADTRVTRTEAVRTTAVARPDWRVAPLVGGTLTAPALPLSGPLALGIHVERRILGPFSVGVWGLSSGQAGVSLSGEF